MADDISLDPSSVHDVQVARLDADMFNADDIDGGTEGLVGSGNLNYLVLQSSQTNEAGQNANPFEVNLNGDGQNGLIPELFHNDLSPTSDSRAINPSDFSHNGDSSSGFLNTATNHNFSQFSEASETNNNNSNSALNTISATHSSLSSSTSASETNNNYFPGDDGTNGNNGNDGNGNNGTNGNNGNNGTGTNGISGLNGNDGNNGNNGTDGKDGHSPDLPPVTPDDSHIGVHVVSDILNANLDLLVNPIGNLVGGLNVDATAILGDILSPQDGLLPHPGLILDGIIGDNQILNNTPVGPLLVQTEQVLDTAVNHVNNVVCDLVPAVPNILGSVGGLLNQVNGDSGIFVTTGLHLPDIGGLGGLGDLSLHIPTTVLDNIIGTTNLHLDLLTDQSDLLTNGLHLAPVDLNILSSGDILGGLTTGITTDNLLGSTVGTVQDVVTHLTDGGDIIGNLIPDAANIPGNLVTEVTNLADPLLNTVQSLANGDLLGVVNTGEVDATVHDLTNSLPLDQVPGAQALVDNLNSTVDHVTDAVQPVADGVTDLLHGILDPVLDQVGNVAGNGLVDNLTDTLHGVADAVPTGDVVGAVTDITAPVADTLHDLVSGDLTGALDPTQLTDTLQDLTGALAGGEGDPLSGVGDVVHGLTDGLTGGVGGDPLGGLTDTLHNLTDGLSGGDITAPVTDIIGGLSGGGDVTEPVTQLVDTLTGGSGSDPLGGLTDTLHGLTDNIPGGDIFGDLLGGNGNAPGTPDTDLTVHTGIDLLDTTLGLPDISATLDPVENLVGDIDLGVNLDTNVVNEVLSGNVQGTIDSLTNTVSNALDVNISLLNPEPDQTSPIGLDIGHSTSGIGDILSGLTSPDATGNSSSGSTSWPEATVSGLADTVTSTLGDTLGATLPDPVGVITEGLNLIHDSGSTSSGGGGLGGLLGGGGGHHGLFG